MSIARLEDVAVWDEDGNVDGLQFDGRERRIQQWREKQDGREFAELVERLQKRNSARRARQDPMRMEQIRENDRRHRESGRKLVRENLRRREKYAADPVVNVCEECDGTWSPPYEQRAKRSRFCSKRCRNKFHGRQRCRPVAGLRDMGIRGKVFAFLRTNYGSTAQEIAEATSTKIGSVRTSVCKWTRDGELVSDGKRPARYSIAGNDIE